MPKFPLAAARTSGLSDDIFGKLAAHAKTRTGKIYPLQLGDTWMEPFEGARAEVLLTKDHPRLHTYAAIQGELSLLSAVHERLLHKRAKFVERGAASEIIDASDVPNDFRLQIVSGATSGLSVAMTALLDPSDEMLLPSPYWPLVRGLSKKLGVQSIEVPVVHRLMDVDSIEAAALLRRELEARITPKTSAIYLNSPNNPTGHIFSNEELEVFVDLAEEHNLWLLADEVYEELAFEEQAKPVLPLWLRKRAQSRTISIHSVSKAYGLSGVRVGYVHGPLEAIAKIRGIVTYETYCAPKPMQELARRALQSGDPWLDRARSSYRTASKMVESALKLPAPSAGTFFFFDTRPYRKEGETSFDFLVRCIDAGVSLTPGKSCGADFEDYARLCFTCVSHAELGGALMALRPLFASNQDSVSQSPRR